MSETDKQILSLLGREKQEGLDLLFQRYYRPLVVFAENYLGNIPASEDVVQEQIIKLWNKKLYKSIHPSALSSFLFTTVKNASLNLLEKKDVMTEAVELPHYQIAQKEAAGIDDEGVIVIMNALNELPERTRQVVEYVMLKDMKYQQAADELGMSINSLKTLLKKGIKDLRIQLKDKRDLIFFLLFKKNI